MRLLVRSKKLALGLAMVIAGLPLLSLVHEALVTHTVCAEHGELVHGARTNDPTHAEPGVRGEAAGSSEHHHEHCALALLERGPAPSTHDVGLSITTPYGTQSFPRTVPPPQQAQLSVAPKTSPPLGLFVG